MRGVRRVSVPATRRRGPWLAVVPVRGVRRRCSTLGLATLLAAGCVQSETTTAPTFQPLRLATERLPDATVGVPYGTDLEVSGGNGAYSYGIIDGTLPDGLSLGATTGSITGTPTQAGGSTFMVQVVSGDGQQVTDQLMITVLPPPTDRSTATTIPLRSSA